MSLSRRTRKAPWLRARKPGNSRDRNMPIIDSMRMKRIGVTPSPAAVASTGRRMKRASWLGIGISACMVVPSRSRRSSTPTVMPPFWMNGKGCAGSTAIGVRIGRYWDDELPVEPLALGAASAPWARRCGCRPRPSRPCSADQQACWSPTRPAAKRLISASCWAGVSPSWLGCVDAGGDLAVEAGHAHHVELVEVGGRDRQEAQALEQGMARRSAPPPARGD